MKRIIIFVFSLIICFSIAAQDKLDSLQWINNVIQTLDNTQTSSVSSSVWDGEWQIEEWQQIQYLPQNTNFTYVHKQKETITCRALEDFGTIEMEGYLLTLEDVSHTVINIKQQLVDNIYGSKDQVSGKLAIVNNSLYLHVRIVGTQDYAVDIYGKGAKIFAETLPQASKWYGVKKSVYPDYTGLEPSFSSETYFLDGDTVINGITNKAVWCNSKSSYIAALRESTDGQQVYITPSGEKTEMLLFNFDVQINDVVYAYDHSYTGIDPLVIPGDPDYDEKVKNQYRWLVQDVQTVDGRKHVVVKGGQSNHTVEWIEGIGTKYMLYENNQRGALSTTSVYALCAVDKDGNTLYSFDTEGIGIRNNCPDWEIIDSTIDKVVKQPASATKLLRDGQMYILRDGKTYSVTGQEVK